MHKLNLDNRTGTVILNSGHALILGHKPDKLSLEQISEKILTERQEVQSLGLFDNSTPNYTTYYPDVTAEDLNPKDEEFIYPVFRMLSEVVLSKGYPIDFSKKGVLKKSMHMMTGQTINVDHETALGNAIGAITEVAWQESYKTASGKIVPAGFNGVFKIDGKSNPRIARGIMMKPPSIHSNSVTVRFGWEPSHTFDTDSEFFDKLGSYTKEGELVRIVVNEIKQYSETSLVGHGADPYAQKIGADGKIVNPDYADNVYSFNADAPVKSFNKIDYKDSCTLSFGADTIPFSNKVNTNNKQNDESMTIKELMANAEKQLGLEVGTITSENFAETLTAFVEGKVDKETLTTLQTELDGVNVKLDKAATSVTTLTNEIEGLKPDALIGKNTLTAMRAEATRVYSLLKGEKADEAIQNSILVADLGLATSLAKQYQEELDVKFPDICQDCQSINISKSTTQKDDAGGEDDGDSNKVLSDYQARQAILINRSSGKKSTFVDYSKSH